MAPPLALVSLRAQQSKPDADPKPRSQGHGEAVQKKREDEAAKKRAEADRERERATRRQDQDDRKRQDTARRREEQDNRRQPPSEPPRRDGDRGRPPVPAEARRYYGPPSRTRIVFIGGYFYDPFFDPHPWWPRTIYPYRWAEFDGRAYVRVLVSPRDAAVYVDGFYAGIVDDFDGIFQNLPLLPGGHTIAFYLQGYRTVNRSVYLTPGSTLKLRADMERLPPGMASAPPAITPALPPPPEGTYIPLHTPPREQPMPSSPAEAARSAGYGVLSLQIHPLSAVVTIDGEEWLTTKPGELVLNLGVGRHTVVVSVPDRPPFSTEVTIREGETMELNVSVPM